MSPAQMRLQYSYARRLIADGVTHIVVPASWSSITSRTLCPVRIHGKRTDAYAVPFYDIPRAFLKREPAKDMVLIWDEAKMLAFAEEKK